ncbi:hypothetical protein BDV25DRAFT_165436 [Aspergillus avenaceus]|uniref:Uncharacterized protein n=1 Tax=Aspergillus avenaceus TaxID=36643 RepID=A0A5N6TFJ8_ASPAV|nr:hypothetical protein BDV25DRAFT_165436 [Aspergillus avenaceus]
MSISNPSVIFHQGLRCTKVPRRSAALFTNPSVPTSSPLVIIPTPSDISAFNADPTSTEAPSLGDTIISNTLPMTTLTSGTQTTDAIPTHLPVTVATTITAVVDPSTSIDATTNTYSLVSSHSSDYHTLLPVASSLITHSKGSWTSATQGSTTYGLATATPAVTGTVTYDNNSTQSSSNSSSAATRRTSLGTLLGSVFGAMAFVALVFLLCLCIYRHRRGKSVISGRNKDLLGYDRPFADTTTNLHQAYMAGTSVHSTMSSKYSQHNYAPPDWTGNEAPSYVSDPFSDSAELHRGSRGNVTQNPSSTVTRATIPQRTVSDSILPAVREGGKRTAVPMTPDERSIYSSERSLGSTLILPGRSSLGSSLQRFSYRISVAEIDPSNANELVTKISPRSTRSDPFDLEVPGKVIHPGGYGMQPRAQM